MDSGVSGGLGGYGLSRVTCSSGMGELTLDGAEKYVGECPVDCRPASGRLFDRPVSSSSLSAVCTGYLDVSHCSVGVKSPLTFVG